MTDHEDIYIKELAKSTLAEWLTSDEFSTRAAQQTVIKNTRLGREMNAAYGSDYVHLADLWRKVRYLWRSSGWVKYEENTLGPKSFGTDNPTLERKAQRMELRGRCRDGRPFSDATQRWIGAMTGQSGKNRFVWLTMNWEALTAVFVEEYGSLIDGMTREQVAERFGLPDKLTKLVIKQLVESGTHREVRRKFKDGTRERQIVVV